MEDLADKGLLEKVQKYSESFAYEEYAAELLQRNGYIMTADELGFRVWRTAAEYTAEGMVAAILGDVVPG